MEEFKPIPEKVKSYLISLNLKLSSLDWESEKSEVDYIISEIRRVESELHKNNIANY